MDFSVLSGNDALILWTLLAGGKGGITAIANILPTVIADIYKKFLENNLEEARAAQDSIASIRQCFQYGNPNSCYSGYSRIVRQDSDT